MEVIKPFVLKRCDESALLRTSFQTSRAETGSLFQKKGASIMAGSGVVEEKLIG